MFARIRFYFGSCPGGRHYYVKQDGVWTCSICGASK